jgi:hypothetical protein
MMDNLFIDESIKTKDKSKKIKGKESVKLS